PLSTASCSQCTSSVSSSVWRTTTSSPRSLPHCMACADRSSWVVVPYFSGSREPRRPRLGPFSTRTVLMTVSVPGAHARAPLPHRLRTPPRALSDVRTRSLGKLLASTSDSEHGRRWWRLGLAADGVVGRCEQGGVRAFEPHRV